MFSVPLRSTRQPKGRNRQRAVCPVITSPCWGASKDDDLVSMIVRNIVKNINYSVSNAESAIITPSFRFWKNFHFLHSELTEIKTFTGITLKQSLHVAYVISIGSPSWFKYFQHKQLYILISEVSNYPPPPRICTEPWHTYI